MEGTLPKLLLFNIYQLVNWKRSRCGHASLASDRYVPEQPEPSRCLSIQETCRAWVKTTSGACSPPGELSAGSSASCPRSSPRSPTYPTVAGRRNPLMAMNDCYQELVQLDMSSPLSLSDQLSRILTSRDFDECIQGLQGNYLEQAIELLDKVPFYADLSHYTVELL